MSIQVASFLVPKNGNTWFIVEDKYIKGGMQVVADAAARDAINPLNVKAGMLVVTQSDRKIWQLGDDLLTWTEFKTGGGGGTRNSVTRPIVALPAGDSVDFNLQLGKTALILYLEVTAPCMVQAFETTDRSDTNPYTFIATADHMIDDGSTLMTDGTILRGRRYTVLSNRSPVPSVDQYFRVTNTGSTQLDAVLNIEYLSIE